MLATVSWKAVSNLWRRFFFFIGELEGYFGHPYKGVVLKCAGRIFLTTFMKEQFCWSALLAGWWRCSFVTACSKAVSNFPMKGVGSAKVLCPLGVATFNKHASSVRTRRSRSLNWRHAFSNILTRKVCPSRKYSLAAFVETFSQMVQMPLKAFQVQQVHFLSFLKQWIIVLLRRAQIEVARFHGNF